MTRESVQEEKGIGGPVGVEIKEKGETTAGKEEEAETEQAGEEAEGTGAGREGKQCRLIRGN